MRSDAFTLLNEAHLAYTEACEVIQRRAHLFPELSDRATMYLIVYAMMAGKLDRLKAEDLMHPTMERLINRVKEAARNSGGRPL